MNNQVEGRLFVNSIFSTLTTMPAYVQELFPGLSRNQSELVASLYQVPGFNVIVEQTIEIIGDYGCIKLFVCVIQDPDSVCSNLCLPDLYHATVFQRAILQGTAPHKPKSVEKN